jgi:uncharacterized protein YqhQ
MPEEKVRLGGMALANGVLVHGPTSWACAVRTRDGRLKVVAEPKRLRGAGFRMPLVRGPIRLAESFAFLPHLKQVLPEAELPFQGRRAIVSLLLSAGALQAVRRTRLGDASKELAAALLTVAPAVLTLRQGSLAAYHGAEHIAIGSYEHDEPRPREHERCGTHLVGPLLATAAVGNVLASRAPARFRVAARFGATVGAVAASTEIFSWMQRNPERPLARALARPGQEFQHRVATAEPTPDQLEVAEAALRACLELESQQA